MRSPSLPHDEAARLRLIESCRILDSEPEPQFDAVAALAAELCDTPMALVTIVAGDRQWFKARVGVGLTSTGRDVAFCAHALERSELVVQDAATDQRFADNPLVTGDPHIRFYAGVPLYVDEGSAIGTLCVLDRVPRSLSPAQLEGLRALSRQVAAEIRSRRGPEPETTKSDDVPVGRGARVGRFVLGPELGRGGVGVVFSARDEGGRRFALKVLLPSWRRNADVVERFVREARVLSRLSSRHVVRIVDVGNLPKDRGDLPWIAMEHLEGRDLDAVLRARGPLPFREACGYVGDACEALAEAHALDFVHRDLKPSNLFLADDGPHARVLKVLDFGIARVAVAGDERLTRVGSVFGSMQYMPPEQMLGAADVDARSDLWSLGVTLYRLLSGRFPFEAGSDLLLCVQVLQSEPVALRAVAPSVPAEVEAIVARCLRKERDERFASALELRDACLSVLRSG